MAVINYETVFIAEPEIPADQFDQLVAKIKQIIETHKGSFTSEDRWGRRRMAYPVQGFREGFYSVLIFNAEPTVVAALDHFYNITDSVIRHLTIRQIKSNKKFAPRRERPAGATDSRPGTRSGGPSRMPRVEYAKPAGEAAASATVPAAPAEKAPENPA